MTNEIPVWICQLYVNILKHSIAVNRIVVDTQLGWCWVDSEIICGKGRIPNGTMRVQEYIDAK